MTQVWALLDKTDFNVSTRAVIVGFDTSTQRLGILLKILDVINVFRQSGAEGLWQ